MLEIDIFNHRILAEFCFTEPGLHLPGLAEISLPVNQQAKSLFKGKLVDLRLLPLLLQRLNHAVQAK